MHQTLLILVMSGVVFVTGCRTTAGNRPFAHAASRTASTELPDERPVRTFLKNARDWPIVWQHNVERAVDGPVGTMVLLPFYLAGLVLSRCAPI